MRNALLSQRRYASAALLALPCWPRVPRPARPNQPATWDRAAWLHPGMGRGSSWHTDARQVAVVDLAQGRVVGCVAVPAVPSGMVLSPDGRKLYVTCAAPQSTVCVIDPGTLKIVPRCRPVTRRSARRSVPTGGGSTSATASTPTFR